MKDIVASIVRHLEKQRGTVTKKIYYGNYDLPKEIEFPNMKIGQIKVEMLGEFEEISGMVIACTLTNILTKKFSRFPVISRSGSSTWVRMFCGQTQEDIVKDAIQYVLR